MKAVISFKGKALQQEIASGMYAGRKIGEKVSGSNVAGFEGYEFEITGGSDKEGFPMRKGVGGQGRKKLLLSGGIGYNPKEKGIRRRKSICGEEISERIVQINFKVVKEGAKKFEEFFKKEEPAAEGEEKKE
jgi:small subunit ribosomal protein S6e